MFDGDVKVMAAFDERGLLLLAARDHYCYYIDDAKRTGETSCLAWMVRL